MLNAAKQFAKEAARFDGVTVPPDQRRQLDLLKLQLELAPPADPKEAEEVTALTTKLQGMYGRGKWCKDAAKPQSGREAPPTEEKSCLDIEQITEILATSRDEKKIREAWEGWHTISVPMRADYARFVELANKGAKELGFADTGAMWRAKYDMPADAFTKEVDRLWEQVKPLYLSLHAYVRMKLHEKYGDVVPAEGPIPAHITGNIWAQDWGNVIDLVGAGHGRPGFSLTDILKRRKTSAVDMVKSRRALLLVARPGADADDVLGAIALHEAARARRRLPRQRVEHRLRRRPAHQDVHRPDRGGLHDDPPRARAQLLPARLQPAAGHLPRQRQPGVPRGDRRHHRAVGDARVSRQDRPPRQGAGRLPRSRVC